MKERGPKHNAWNTFYEYAWDARRRLMQDIIDKGERNPLRVLNRFESTLRFSEKDFDLDEQNEVTRFEYKLNCKRAEEDVSNFSRKEQDILTDLNCDKLPHGLPIKKDIPFFDSTATTSTYTETDVNRFIADYVNGKEFDAIIELGSGFCQNLIRLYYEGIPSVPLYGLEYTNSGVECGNMLASLDENMQMHSMNFDYNAPDFSALKGLYNNVFVFSRHSIEQVQAIPGDLFEKIAEIGESVTCMHFEPFGFQYQLTDELSPVDSVQRDFFFSKGWNVNFVQAIVDQFLQGKIDLMYLSKNIFGGEHVGNATSFAMWKSID